MNNTYKNYIIGGLLILLMILTFLIIKEPPRVNFEPVNHELIMAQTLTGDSIEIQRQLIHLSDSITKANNLQKPLLIKRYAKIDSISNDSIISIFSFYIRKGDGSVNPDFIDLNKSNK